MIEGEDGRSLDGLDTVITETRPHSYPQSKISALARVLYL